MGGKRMRYDVDGRKFYVSMEIERFMFKYNIFLKISEATIVTPVKFIKLDSFWTRRGVDKFVNDYNAGVGECERIQAVYFGRKDVNEDKRRLFLITNQIFPLKLEEAIKKFDLIALQVWPCGHERAEHSDFEKVLDYAGE